MCRFDRVVDEVTIALVGKYTRFEDAYISVTKALKHAALSVNRKLIVNVYGCFRTVLVLHSGSKLVCIYSGLMLSIWSTNCRQQTQ